MNQQELNLPRPVRIIGQYKILIGLMTLLGGLAGGIFAALNPPPGSASSSAMVMFTAPSCPQGGICGGFSFSPASGEAPVLKAFPSGVRITVVKGNVVAISATGGTSAQAAAIANKAAGTYISSVGSLTYMGLPSTATLIGPASSAAGTTPPKQLVDDALLGALFGGLAGIITALAAGQTIIDPVTLPRGPRADGAGGGTGQPTPYATTMVSLEQLARDYRQGAAGDGPSGRFRAGPP
jgi:hypothetical protein